ncbi:hypothetical protein CF327_g4192 [Tilletia walkeri]|uniref:Uncharacterized protein n=1 Tax=Tilletia walkeri TaxID=117179 RepID=A0A8X7N848_9BASI|nr:hypothetical protein CF327_g4192 [Tilletia walkeri]KAE8268927.1 hypothetical protein A4X09_0g3403 [Tilletia walkeri]
MSSRKSTGLRAGVLMESQNAANRNSMSPSRRGGSASPSKSRRQSFGVSEADVSSSVEGAGKLWGEYFDRLGFVVQEQPGKRASLGKTSTGSDGSDSKAEIRSAEARLVDLRNQLELELDTLSPMFTISPSLSYHAEEARTLMREVEEFGMEIARARMERKEGVGEGSGPMAASEGAGEGDETSNVPVRGTLTTEEAEAYCDAQILELQDVQEQTERTNAAVEQAKKELKTAMKEVDKLGYERSREEALAKEAQSGLGSGGKRDLKIEEACRQNKAQLQTLCSMIGLRSFEPTSDRSLRAVYEPKASAAGKRSKAVILDVRFREPGGRLNWFDISLVDAAEHDMSRARRVVNLPDGLALRLTQALDSNDLPLLVNEIAVAIQTDVL